MSATLTSATTLGHPQAVAEDFIEELGAAVRRLRESRGVTQAELAERVGLGRTSMTNLERGRQNPPLSLLPKLARALGVSVLDLVREATRGQSEESDDVLLSSQVQDESLRRWASQVISDYPKPGARPLVPLRDSREKDL